MKLDTALRFLENFSIITVAENKIPNFPWKSCQQEKLSEDEFIKRAKYKGGIFKSDGTEIPPTNALGIVTGYDYLEVIDIDLKVFSTPKEMQDFWNELYTSLIDNIYDFDNKFVIYKTKSGGYHILYKSKRVEGNQKLAKLEGHKEAVIETRGTGGYVFIYPDNRINEKSYFDIQFITDQDRQTLMNICKAYDYKEPEQEKIERKTKKHFTQQDGKTPWDEFNEKNSCLDIVVPDEFSIPPRGNKSKHTIIKRHNSKSPHSGYIYNNGCMYLFSTGTIYPAEKLISPFTAFAYKYHNGDFTAAAKDLYEQGYGDRLKSEVKILEPELKEDKPIILNSKFPIEIFPKPLQYYIQECADKLQMNPDYMGCSLLWLTSVIVGNTFDIEVKKGWKEKAIMWFALVGQAGVGKTPSIDKMIFPLTKINNQEIKKYLEQKQKFDEFNKLTKKEQEEIYGKNYKINEPQKTQFIVNDITIEALVQMHQQSDNAVGVFKDELAGWLKDMNKYRAGSDLEFWLSSWSAKAVSLNRKTSDSNFVDKPFIPVLGGIQPTIFNNLSTEENKENGFLDRLLLAYPDVTIGYYVDEDIDYKAIAWYSDFIKMFYETVKKHTQRIDGDIEPITFTLNSSAKKEWIRIFNKITDSSNSDEENQYLKSMYPKQKSYIPRFALLIRILDTFVDGFNGSYTIDSVSMIKAEMLSDYFVNNAKKVKLDSAETKDIKTIIAQAKTNVEKIEVLYNQDPMFNKTKASEILGVSRQYIIKVVKKLQESESK